MKFLIENINEIITENFFSDINAEIISEKLQEPHLIELAKQLKKFSSKNKNFRGIFGQYSVAWDKITESDFSKYPGGDREGTKRARKCFKQGDSFENNLILFFDANNKLYAACTLYGMINFHEGQYDNRYNYDKRAYEKVPKAPSNDYNIKQKDVAEACAKCAEFWILSLSDNKVYDVQNARRTAKQGMISPENYTRIARENIKRYEKMLAQRKAERTAKNDVISPKVKEILNKVLELSSKIMAGGAKYADLEYRISELLSMCYGERHYGRNGSTGSNGLLVLYKNYIDSNLRAAKAQYTYDNNSKIHADAITKKIEQIENKIAAIEEKL